MDKKKKINNGFDVAQILLFILCMVAGFVIGLMLMMRPTVSETEKRKLTEFPEFTVESFLDGSYFSQISTWYADTYPMRDVLIQGNQAVKKLYGIQTSMILGDDNKQADEIPDISNLSKPETSKEESSVVEESSKEESSKEESSVEESSVEESSIEESSVEESSEEESKAPPVIPDDPAAVQEEIQHQIVDGLYVQGDAAYSRYFFYLDLANRYAEIMSRTAQMLEGKTTVYNILVPDSTQIMLDEATIHKLGGSSEGQSIAYHYAMMDPLVQTIDTFNTLYEHRDDYIYFRTDHHWTQLGAYYIYRNFMEAKGLVPYEISSYESADYGQFLGTYYDACVSDAMRANPDQMTVYFPHDTTEMVYWTRDGERVEWKVISDYSQREIYTKYWCFIGTDNPYSIIENPKITDGSSCVLVKESFGNTFAPFLVDHYQYVHIIDYRYYTESIMDFVVENEIDDLIFMNNLAIIGSEYVVNLLDNQLQ